jgi:F0F1-type ATP synthase membrane subunit b/b'
LIDEGRHMPFSKFTMIDEERALEIIDQMRISIPEEIEKAARVLAQRDRILAQANEEAARIVQLARERSEQLIDREAAVQLAQTRATQIVEEARREAEAIVGEADQYAMRSLAKLEHQLERMINVVRDSLSDTSSANGSASVPAAPPPPAAMPAPQPFVPPRPLVEVGAAADKDDKR